MNLLASLMGVLLVVATGLCLPRADQTPAWVNQHARSSSRNTTERCPVSSTTSK